jgi:hypothetical protein
MPIDLNEVDADMGDLLREDRDWPLSFRWRADDSVLVNFNLPDHPKPRDALNAILTEAVLANEAGHAISYSRRHEFYNGLCRYRGNSFTYRTVVPAVDFALCAALLEEERARPGSRGWQSRFWATPLLVDSMRGCSLSFCYHEIIILKNSEKKLQPYSDTDLTRQMRKELEAINRDLATIEVALQGPGIQRTEHGWIVAGTPTPPTPHYLRRIFNRGRFDCGGRAYGWWQGLPSSYRALMRINGEDVLEPDFAQLHCQIIYAQRGLELIGDAYETGEYPRSFGKAGFNIALNAPSRTTAVPAIANKLKIETAEAAKLLSLITKKHRAIADVFCSDTGIRLMRVDSDITVRAVRDCLAVGIPVLPVHDSLIARARQAGQVAEIMEKAFAKAFRKAPHCTVRVKSKSVPTDGEEDEPLVDAA